MAAQLSLRSELKDSPLVEISASTEMGSPDLITSSKSYYKEKIDAAWRLAMHLQHLENTRTTVNEKISDDHIWRGSDEISDSNRYFEPFNGKKFSHVCTAPVKYDPNWITTTTTNKTSNNIAYIVTGAQLEVKKHGSKSVLHLRLRFTGVSDHNVVQKEWVHGPT